MKKCICVLLCFSFVFPINPVHADGLFGLFRGRRQQVQVQAVNCYQPTYQQAVNYQVVAAVPLVTIPLAVDLQAYSYSVNAGAFQSFRDYMISKSNQPSESVAPVQPSKVASDSDNPLLEGAQVLAKNCIGCHQAGKNPKKGLAIVDPNGNIYSNLPWTEIMERVSSNDPEQRMPPKKTLATQDIMSIFRLAATSLPQNSGMQTAAKSDKIDNPFD